jgi:hypothetical protein|tara:strand:- start:51 stop:446 length:396 start_codon:yes stop_codon:yes gene_type:complete
VSNDFEKIQQIYEEGFRGQHAILRSYGPNMKYAPDEGRTPPGYTLSYIPGHLPLASPDTGKQRPVGGEGAMQGITAPIDEEILAAEIINLDVLEKVDELLDEAEKDEMEYAILQLSRLREHVISLSQGKRD